jgi:1,4-dihydroxy-6-naphthoate synthase
MLIRCAISPDADDLFMFRALILGLLPTAPYRFEISTADTDRLNRVARGEAIDPAQLPHVSAVSVAWYPRIWRDWQLLPHGGSVGRGYGPVLVAPPGRGLDSLRGARVAVPGTSTTAYTVLRQALDFEPVVIPITPPSLVFEALRAGTVEAALLIHEGRLTYSEHGLQLLLDTGLWWQEQTGLPLPLGGNVIRRDLGAEHIAAVSQLLRRSIHHGLENRAEAIDWLLAQSQTLQSAAAVDHYLSLYANADTADYGESGRAGIAELLRRGQSMGILPACPEPDYAP